MTFRKNSLIFYESQIVYIVFALLCLTMISVYGFVISFLFSGLFLILIFVNPRLYNEFVTINEIGVSCCKSGKIIWQYEWDDIEKLQKSSRYLMPSLEIVICDTKNTDSKVLTGHYFQLGKTAKQAIDKYYKIDN